MVWDALASPTGADAATRERRLAQLRDALAAVPAARFEVWVTHQFVLSDLTGNSTSSSEGLLLKAATDGGRPQVLARLNLA